MTRHLEAAIGLASELMRMEAVERIILYGSVAKGTEREGSDIDLALVIPDTYRSFAACLDSAPWTVQCDIDLLQSAFQARTGIRPHVVMYYESEFERGITLAGRGSPEPLMLHGRVIFDRRDAPPSFSARR